MLSGKKGGGYEDGNLFTGHDRYIGSPECHLGFTVPHITTDEPVHGPMGGHVGIHIFDSLELIIRLIINKGVLKFLDNAA